VALLSTSPRRPEVDLPPSIGGGRLAPSPAYPSAVLLPREPGGHANQAAAENAKAVRPPQGRARPQRRGSPPTRRAASPPESAAANRGQQPLPPRAISCSCHSLFKVLCNFPPAYLFAIGLTQVFSFRWDLPPFLRCTTKQRDSARGLPCGEPPSRRLTGGFHPLWRPLPRVLRLGRTGGPSANYNSAGRASFEAPADFKFEPFPLHSLLLRESRLVSIPPLIDMLKFSFTVPNPNCPSQSRRFFQVWLLLRLPR